MINIADPSAVILLHKVHPLLDLLNLVPSPIFLLRGVGGAAPAPFSPEFRENRILSLHCLCMAWGTRISNIRECGSTLYVRVGMTRTAARAAYRLIQK